MAYKATPEVIQSIKREIERRKLSVTEVAQLLSDAGHPLGESTIRRILRDGSEEKDSFRYETTIRPIWNVFMTDADVESSKKDLLTRISDLEALVAMKDEAIADLRERLAAVELSHGEKCRDCNASHDLWKEQIRIKDQRIDRKDKQLDDQSEQIRYLQGQINRLMDIVLGRLENNA